MADVNKIILDLEVREGNIKQRIESLNESIKKATQGSDSYELSLKKLQQAEIKLAETSARLQTAKTNLGNSMLQTSKAMEQTSDKTGAATSAVLELGRVVQDAPYGIRGMANNITQLVSQVSFATVSAGGFTAALKQMGKAMLGPLGVVFAISAVVSLFDGMYGGQKKAEKSTEDLTEELTKQIEVLDSYASALNRGNLSLEEQSGIINAVTVSNKEFKKIIESTNGNLDEQINALKQFRLEKQQQLELDTKISRLSEINQELDKSNIDTIEEATIAINKLKKEREEALSIAYGQNEDGITRAYNLQIIPLENIIKQLNEQKQLLIDINSLSQGVQLIEKGSELQLKQELSDLKQKQSRVEALTDTWYLYKIEIDEIEAKLKKISDFGKTKGIKVEKVEKVSPFKTGDELDIDIKSNEEALLKYNRDILLQNLRNQEALEISTAKSENEKNNIRLRYAKKIAEENIKFEADDLKRRKKSEEIVVKEKYNTFKVEAELRLKSYIDSINKNDKLSKAQRDSAIASATSDTKALLSGAEAELKSSLSEIDSKYEPMFDLLDTLHKARLDAFGVTNQETELQKITKFVNAYQSIMGGILPFIQGEFERQKVVEENKTNALNEELNNRLLNEELSKNERARIQNEIAQNDEALRKKKEIIEKKQFQITKMANIAGALVQTYSGAMAAYWNTLQNPINKLLPDGGLLRAKINAGIATGAGLLQVAAIARQKFQSSASSAPVRGGGGGGSDGGGMADRSFNFNLVGNNTENQLANAIQGQFNQPLKAYVVSRDMSNQQQLDANIVDSARF
jgi:hypothetical protein